MSPDPEFMRDFVPGVFRYEKEADMVERALEAYRFYLRTKVEKLGLEHYHAMGYNAAITDVLDLLSPDDEDQQGDGQ